MRYAAILLGLAALSCSCPMSGKVSLTEAVIMDPSGTVLKTIRDEGVLNEIGAAWRSKTPAGAAVAMSNEYTLQLACSDGSSSTWHYDSRGYVRKRSERDASIYTVADNSRLLEIISP